MHSGDEGTCPEARHSHTSQRKSTKYLPSNCLKVRSVTSVSTESCCVEAHLVKELRNECTSTPATSLFPLVIARRIMVLSKQEKSIPTVTAFRILTPLSQPRAMLIRMQTKTCIGGVQALQRVLSCSRQISKIKDPKRMRDRISQPLKTVKTELWPSD
ncbi:uncharacterized protein ANIA_05079 [Aspergillus nidulans FGSC A4]|uniref:Uncharacterized protein n=1 Tax=Emericella nidulans (strain FGSC A4 / ATCC 38163 / CBS 112.46 / NRRL 194 / M139) TaxID=227321 RepID=C8V800_EMENI|nr:hypothetical protein [Aspergillus nidulans FGSC A4]CBF76135.1 TPA: conserved hypothetical protein [Aspergillus nidulans FGSC A4]